jgi:hypothetical protein
LNFIRKSWSLLPTLIVLIFVVTGCGGVSQPEENYFIPPTLVPQSAPLVLETPTDLPPTPTPDCEADLVFVKDGTIPDGTAFPPGATMDKRWIVKNEGTCNWDSRYRVRLVSGPSLGADDEFALFPARSGSEAEIHIEFVAPLEPGFFRSSWQAYDPEGESFGQLFFIEIEVDPNLIAQPSATPGSDVEIE